MLMMWKRRQAHGSDLVGILKEALVRADRNNLASEFQDRPKHGGNFRHYVCETCQKLICEGGVQQHPGPKQTTQHSNEIAWRQVDTIGQKGKGEWEFEGARGIAAAKPDRIAVTDRKNDRVVICDSQGNNWQAIDVTANDVVAAHQKYWVVVLPEVVNVYNRDNAEFVFKFKTVGEAEEPRSVNLISAAVKRDGKIIVADNTKVLTEHSPDGAILHNIPINITPFFTAVVPDQREDQLVELIAVSDRHQPVVYIMEVCDGDVATTVKVIHANLNGTPAMTCWGVCANDSGAFIATTTKSYNEGHVHHYDTRGRFITCVAKGLYGVCFTADGQRLAVADFQSVKIIDLH